MGVRRRHAIRTAFRNGLLSRLVAVLLSGMLVWCLAARRRRLALSTHASGTNSSTRGGTSGSTGSDANPTCPLVYRRLTVEEIRAWLHRPYLLGEPQQPSCTNCRRNGGWADICAFRGGDLCQDWQWQPIKDAWLERGYELALRLTPCDMWPLVRGRTVFLLGDSQMLDFFKAAQCFLYEFWPSLEHTNVTTDEAVQVQLSMQLPASCADMLQGTRICYIRVDKGEVLVGTILPLLVGNGSSSGGTSDSGSDSGTAASSSGASSSSTSSGSSGGTLSTGGSTTSGNAAGGSVAGRGLADPSRDLLVVNFGLHHSSDYKERLAAFEDYYAAHAAVLPRTLWQPTPPQHFAGGDGSGEWPGGKPPFECGPIANFSVVGEGTLVLEDGKSDPHGMLHGNWRNEAAGAVMRRAGIPVLPSFNESFWMADFHRDNGGGLECTHFCHPSAPQAWVLALYRTLRDLQLQPPGQHRGTDGAGA